MSSVFDKMRDFFTGDDDYYEDDYEQIEETVVDIDPVVVERKRSGPPNFSNSKVVNIHQNAKMDIMNFIMAKYEVTGEICNYIKLKKPVVVNMQNLDKGEAQRALDYLTGATFALDGTVEKIADNIFIFSPVHISVSTISEELKQKTNFSFQ